MCASRWSFTKNHYMMHGQQNVKFRKFIVTKLRDMYMYFIFDSTTNKVTKFHSFTVHFDSLSFILTNSCTFSYNYVSVF